MADSFNQPIPPIGVDELAQCLATEAESLQLVDVREPQEVAICSLAGFTNLPLSEFEQWSGDIQTLLDPAKETLVMCHHGMRSAQMCQWLMSQGFANVKNVTGGIDAYSLVVDPTVPRY